MTTEVLCVFSYLPTHAEPVRGYPVLQDAHEEASEHVAQGDEQAEKIFQEMGGRECEHRRTASTK